jgi:acetyltransferase-like isoleucine patch superfamily enzyme
MSFPAPRYIYGPIFLFVSIAMEVWKFFYRQLWVIPRFKVLMTRHGTHLRTGIFVPFVIGHGRIYAGNRVSFYGKVDIIFGAILKHIPELHIGDRTTIGHNVTFDVSSILSIGSDCLIARNVTFQDCNGHHLHPEKRRTKVPLTPHQVKPITIGDNVWIGTGAYVLPGSTIGSGSVIGAGTIIKGDIPENSLVRAGQPRMEKIVC